MQNFNLKAEPRDVKGKGNLRVIREQGWVPAVLYGPEVGNRSIKVDLKELRQLLVQGGRNHLFELVMGNGNEKHNVMIKEMSMGPVKGEVLHVDFQQVSLKSKIHTKVPIRLVGDAVGVDNGGTIQHGIREIDIECLPSDIPDGIQVDISSLDVGDSLYIKDIVAIDNVAILAEGESLVVTIVQPRLEVETEEAAEGAGEADKANDGADTKEE